MSKRIKVKTPSVPRIVNTGAKQPLVDPKVVAEALGAEIVDRGYGAAIARATEKLRKKSLPKRTSTYVEGSIRQTQGSYAEAQAQLWLAEGFGAEGRDWVILMWQEAKKEVFGGCGPSARDDKWEAIRNSQNGDLYVYRAGEGPTTIWTQPEPELLFSVEVKSSNEWPSASINHSELFNSSAKYLLGITAAGTWICSMDDARKNARLKETYRGSFYTVDPCAVRNLTFKEIIDDEERKGTFIPVRSESDIPF